MRLIDADELLKKILSLTITVTGLRAGKRVLLELLVEYRDAILQVVKEQPTVDAVEVVRCQNCTHCYTDGNGLMLCGNARGLSLPVVNGYCNFGERRTQND